MGVGVLQAANSTMLAQLNSQMRVAQNMMMRLSEFSMIPRMILSSSGSVNRVAALLDAVDPAQYDALNDAPGNRSLLRVSFPELRESFPRPLS